jgi:hypothetical protein
MDSAAWDRRRQQIHNDTDVRDAKKRGREIKAVIRELDEQKARRSAVAKNSAAARRKREGTFGPTWRKTKGGI